jgi:hypothetical protein
MDIEKPRYNYENVIVILSIIAVSLIIYRLIISTESFEQVDICDYNSPDPNEFCQSIQKGCSELIHENKNLNQNIKDHCSTLPKETKDMINTAIECNDTSNKLIMNNYVQKEVCSQIKNLPDNVLTPSTDLLSQKLSVDTKNKPLDNLQYLDSQTSNFVDNYAPF